MKTDALLVDVELVEEAYAKGVNELVILPKKKLSIKPIPPISNSFACAVVPVVPVDAVYEL
jgi:hypothetical protein